MVTPTRPPRRRWTVAAGEGGVVVGFKAGEGCIKHVSPRDNDDVEPQRQLATSEEFSGQSFCSISFNG
jgi:hypothetical protein